MDSIPSMAVKETGSEVSASIEETNRVRAELGLKPLAEGKGSNKEAEAAERGRELAAQRKQEAEEEAMRAKLEDAKRKRQLHAKVSGKGIGEQLDGEEMDSAAAWVAKSRRGEEAAKAARSKARAEGRARPKGKGKPKPAGLGERYDEMDEESQLSGALVGHSTDDFKAGEDVVLTLADESILDEKEGSYALREGDELLENVSMAEQQRRERARDAARGVRERDDPLGGSSILDKYDEPKERATVRLDGSGSVDEARLKKLAAVKQRLAAQQASGGVLAAHDLSSGGAAAAVPKLAVGADYMTKAEAEAAGFKKPAHREKKKLRKKSRASAGALDLDAMAAAEAVGGGASNLGSRGQRAARAEERAAEAQAGRDERAQRFERALEIAEGRAAERLRGPAAAGGGGGEDVEMGEAGEAEEESAEVDAELYSALARARRVGKMTSERRSEDHAAARLQAQLEEAERWAAERRDEGGIPAGDDAPPPEGSIEFSETSEFIKSVQAKEEIDEAAAGSDLPSVARKRAQEAKERAGDKDKDAAEGGKEDKVKVKQEKAGAAGGWGAVGEGGGGHGNDDDDDEEEDDDEDEQLKGLHDREVSSGLAAALQMARTRNMLGEEKEAAGRMFDSKGAGLHNYEEGSEAEKGVQLNYFDEYGRKMTQKEAFRQLSWKFHGKGPSKKRKEKRMAAFEAQMTEQKDDRAMAYMGVLQRAQQSTKSAHVVLTGQHAIKASEARSGPGLPGGRRRAWAAGHQSVICP